MSGEQMHDSFISYCTEDERFAGELAGALIARGLRVWYAPLALKVGDRILAGIDEGLRSSRSGTIIVSKAFLEKRWTAYELDVLVRQAIEHGKPLLQIWHGVTKANVETRYMGLTGMLALESRYGLSSIVDKIALALAEFAPLRALIPSWEDPVNRFLAGTGEILLNSSESDTISIFRLLLDYGLSDFPLFLEGRQFSRSELVEHADKALRENGGNGLFTMDELTRLRAIIRESKRMR